MYNRHNFHKHTFCVFTQVSADDLPAEKADYKSKSGSEYFFTEEGVYRRSNHWGRAANCKWRLQGSDEAFGRTKIGYARWEEFHRDNDTEKLYFITYDNTTANVSFQHKSNMPEGSAALLRTASETTKIIKQIRLLLSGDGWARHYDLEISDLRKQIIYQLIHTDSDLQHIKSALLPK